MSKQLIIIGGGAAGFFCAVNAAHMNSNLKITLLEKQNKVLQKVKVSGGGRCNVTNACFQNSELTKKYPRGKNFLKKSFTQFSTKDTIEWFRSRKIELKTEPDGRMFPASNTSQTIIDCLLNEATKYKIDVQLNSEVIEIKKENNQFNIELKNKQVITADFLMVASGGFPKIEQYHWLVSLGHHIVQPIPSLFTFNTPNTALKQLMGVAVGVRVMALVGVIIAELEAVQPLLSVTVSE